MRMVAGLCTISLLSGCAMERPPHVLRGQLVVVARGGEPVQLGRVKVGVLDRESVLEHLRVRRELAETEASRIRQRMAGGAREGRNADAEKQRLDLQWIRDQITREEYDRRIRELRAKSHLRALERRELARAEDDLAALQTPAFAFEGIEGEWTTETDAAGAFSVELPGDGSYVLAAHASRVIRDSVETYYWLVAIPSKGRGEMRIVLDRDNTISTSSPFSLVDLDPMAMTKAIAP